IATFRRLRENRKPSERTRSSPLDVAIEKNTTGGSCPWNLSTVPTRTTAGSAALVTQELRKVLHLCIALVPLQCYTLAMPTKHRRIPVTNDQELADALARAEPYFRGAPTATIVHDLAVQGAPALERERREREQ